MSFKFTDERIRAMLQGRRAVRRIPFPGIESSERAEAPMVGLRLLTGNEADAARGEATQRVNEETKRLQLNPQERMIYDPEVVDIQIMRNIVRVSVVQADADGTGQHQPFFSSASEVDALPVDIVYRLHEAYRSLEELVDPDPLTQEEQDAIFAELKKTQHPAVLLLAYPRSTLQSLLLSLVSQSSS